MMQRLKAVLQHPLFRRTLYLLAFGVGGYVASGTPWLRWVYTEIRVAFGSDTFRAAIGSWPLAIIATVVTDPPAKPGALHREPPKAA